MPKPVPHNRIQIKERREDVLVLLTKGMKRMAEISII